MSSRTVRLLNRHGYYLEIKKTGEVVGTKDDLYSKYVYSYLAMSSSNLFCS